MAPTATELGILELRSEATPTDKTAHLGALRSAEHRALIVGDGLTDTAALAAAHVSTAPAFAADAGRTAADFVFLREGLEAVPSVHQIAQVAAHLIRQNFGLAVENNCIAIPLAVAGLVAALAMSTSSILVIANSLRLNMLPIPGSGHPADANAAAATVRA